MSNLESQETTDAPNAVCAFTVVIDGDGIPRVFGAGVQGVIPLREPTALDIRRSVLELAADYQARAAAEYVIDSLQQSGFLPTAEIAVSERVQAALDKSSKTD